MLDLLDDDKDNDMATPRKTHKKYRIVGCQPADGPCEHCDAPGIYRWGGKSFCHLHCSELTRARTIMRRGATAVKQALGPDYAVEIKIYDKARGVYI